MHWQVELGIGSCTGLRVTSCSKAGVAHLFFRSDSHRSGQASLPLSCLEARQDLLGADSAHVRVPGLSFGRLEQPLHIAWPSAEATSWWPSWI